MAVMGFSHDPGPLPFSTIRDAKWANRLEGVPPFVEIVGEHGCKMPRVIAKVLGIAAYEGAPPAHLAAVYAGRALIEIRLERATAEDLMRAGIPLPVEVGRA
jgi:hypothetical protein